MSRFLNPLLTTVAAFTVFATPLASVHAEEESLKSIPLTELLNLKTSAFDSNLSDFDIFTALFMDVWGLLPESKIQVISDGNEVLTAFIPNDRAFKRLVTFLTSKTLTSESNIATAVMNLGEKTVENILLYHIIPGQTLTYTQALSSDGVTLSTISGSSIRINVSGSSLLLIDKKTKHTNPVIVSSKSDLNLGNKQIAHGINQVLLP